MINIGFLTLFALQYTHVLYQWGGNVTYDERLDAVVADCSGFVLKVLSDAGVLLPDMTAQDIYNYCLKREDAYSGIACDSLLFFGKSSDKITHVSIAIDSDYMIEAAGAGSESVNMSKEQLIQRDARVRIKPIKSRSDLVAGLNLNLYKGESDGIN